MQRVRIFTLVFLATVLFGNNAFSQEIKVISGHNNYPLPYATVINHTHPLISSSDKNGVARLIAAIGDTFSVSYVGYKTAVFRFNEDKLQTVSLLQEQNFLPSVTVGNCRKTKELSYKNSEGGNELKGNNGVKRFGGVYWSKGSNSNARVAIRLNPFKTQAILKDFSFWNFQRATSAKIFCSYSVAD